MRRIKFQRVWAMPNSETFTVRPIGDLVNRYLKHSLCSVDPFARNTIGATWTNDLNTATTAAYHLEAVEFLELLHTKGVLADLVLVDPPYSPRQVKECYDSIGRQVTQDDALLGKIRKVRKAAIDRILQPGGIVITCGWNTVGMGKSLGYVILEILLVCHGSDHNDTIIVVEQKGNLNKQRSTTTVATNSKPVNPRDQVIGYFLTAPVSEAELMLDMLTAAVAVRKAMPAAPVPVATAWQKRRGLPQPAAAVATPAASAAGSAANAAPAVSELRHKRGRPPTLK